MDKFKNTENLENAYKSLEKEFTKKCQQVAKLKKSTEDKAFEKVISKVIEACDKSIIETGKENFALQRELINNFFNGYYYITFESEEETKIFIEFIKDFDLRFRYNETTNFDKYKEVVWKFSKTLHHHQLEFSSELDYWKSKDIDIKELKFNKIAGYLKASNKLKQSDIVKMFERLFNGESE